MNDDSKLPLPNTQRKLNDEGELHQEVSDNTAAKSADAFPPTGPQHEVSILDYVKSRLTFKRNTAPVQIPALVNRTDVRELKRPQSPNPVSQSGLPFPWLSIGGLSAALLAQRLFEPPDTSAPAGIALYIAAFGLILAAVFHHEWPLAPLAESTKSRDPLSIRWIPFLISGILLIPTFILLGGTEIVPGIKLPAGLGEWFHLQDNLFTWFNLLIWLATLTFFIWSLWLTDPNSLSLLRRALRFLKGINFENIINRRTALLLAAALIVVFFRVYHIQQTPAEPFSDHAEKILDVYDVSQGQTHIFFPRNTGREAIQMYWTLLMSWIFGTGLSFISLKIGTVLLGIFTLPFIYLLGREIANPRVGLLAVFMAGIGYWPNVISRIGLRFPLDPLFVAPVMFYVIHGLRTRSRNDFILAGIFLGLGLNGYSPYRIVPFLVVAAFVLFMLHRESKGIRQDAITWLVIVGLASLIIFLPLLRYALDNPSLFSLRAFSRLGLQPDPSSNQAPPGSLLLVFFSNSWNALRMFNWNDGVIWVNSLPNRPALDVVSGALFLIGIVLLLYRYVQKRKWVDLFLLLSVPILLLPSILSLAFPDENPAMNRTAGAIIPTFLIVAMALDGLITTLASNPHRRNIAYILTVALLIVSAAQNFDLVFNQFDQNYRTGAWNSSEMGAVIQRFGVAYGETNTAWIVPFPFWVDTRLPGIWIGIPNRDFAMPSDNLVDTLQITGPKLFIVKANLEDPSQNDQKSLDLLQQLYPQGSLSLYRSSVIAHDFWIYIVGAQQ